jgi:hypothetical protein
VARRRKVPKAEYRVLDDSVLSFVQIWPPGMVEVRVLTVHCTVCGFSFSTNPDLPHECPRPDTADGELAGTSEP